MGKSTHLGLDDGPKRTTLAYANDHRSWKIYEVMFYYPPGQVTEKMTLSE